MFTQRLKTLLYLFLILALIPLLIACGGGSSISSLGTSESSGGTSGGTNLGSNLTSGIILLRSASAHISPKALLYDPIRESVVLAGGYMDASGSGILIAKVDVNSTSYTLSWAKEVSLQGDVYDVAVSGNTYYVSGKTSLDQSYFLAVDSTTGSLKWTYTFGTGSVVSLLPGDSNLAFVGSSSTYPLVIGKLSTSGSSLWIKGYRSDSGWLIGFDAKGSGNDVIIASGQLTVVDESSGGVEKVIKYTTTDDVGIQFSDVGVLSDGYVLAGEHPTDSSKVVILRADGSGAPVWAKTVTTSTAGYGLEHHRGHNL